MRELINDAYVMQFERGENNNFLQFLQDISEATTVERCGMNEVTLREIKSPTEDESGRPWNFGSTVSEIAITETTSRLGTKLVLRVQDGEHLKDKLIATQVMKDFAKPLGVNTKWMGRLLEQDRMSEFVKMTNDQIAATATPKDECVLIVRGEKVRCIGTDKYAYLDQYELAQAVVKNLPVGSEFAYGVFTHDMTVGYWTASEMQAIVKSVYGLSKEPLIAFITSDTKRSGAKVRVYLREAGSKDDREAFLLAEVASLEHKHTASPAQFGEACKDILARTQVQIEKIEKLKDVAIKNPVATFDGLIKSMVLPLEASLNVMDVFAATYDGYTCTAQDIYLHLQDIILEMKRLHQKESSIAIMSERLAKNNMFEARTYTRHDRAITVKISTV